MMTESRPDPQELLLRIQEEESALSKGKLKIFFGAAAGVGKTYAMLLSAAKLKKEGFDVVAGVVLTHGRKETEALFEGLEVIPLKDVEYKGRALKEFDLDRLLERRPQIVLVDELAHSNAPGSRHEKRWQDVQELLDNGIDVHTTMNVQHLESVHDIVAQITGITVRETVPDSIFEKAWDVVVVDIPVDELLNRLSEGKIYLPEQSRFALDNFFRKGNLIALRELALRSTAERVDAQMQKYRRDESIKEVWPASDRIAICLGPSPLSARLVRATRRMAAGLHAEWIAVYVETPGSANMSDKRRERVRTSMRLAEQLGGETVVLTGTNVAEELISYARRRNCSKIVIGKPARPRWRELLFGSVVDDVIRKSGEIDVYVITGDLKGKPEPDTLPSKRAIDYRGYVLSAVVVAITTVICQLMFRTFALVNLVMFYLLAVAIVAVQYGRGPSILASLLGVIVFDFMFIPPYFSFAVSDSQYLITLAVMLTVGLSLSTLTDTVRRQAIMARARERRTAALYRMAREQSHAATPYQVLEGSAKQITEIFDCSATILLPDTDNRLAAVAELSNTYDMDSNEFGVAQWVYMNGQMAGIGTATLPGAKALYLPLVGSKGVIGTIGILPSAPEQLLNPEERHFLETFVNNMALATERAILSKELAEELAKSAASKSDEEASIEDAKEN